MDIARLELCKKLYAVSRWKDTLWSWYCDEARDDDPVVNLSEPLKVVGGVGYFDHQYPAYDLSYLLRKLPKNMTEFWGRAYPASPCLMYSGSEWVIFYQSTMTGEHNTDELFGQFADIPEDATAKLAIELFKQRILM